MNKTECILQIHIPRIYRSMHSADVTCRYLCCLELESVCSLLMHLWGNTANKLIWNLMIQTEVLCQFYYIINRLLCFIIQRRRAIIVTKVIQHISPACLTFSVIFTLGGWEMTFPGVPKWLPKVFILPFLSPHKFQWGENWVKIGAME